MKKKCILLILTLALVFPVLSSTAMATTVFSEPIEIFAANDTVTLYAPDGRTREVPANEVDAYLKVGWYKNPVTILYSSDGHTRVTFLDEVDAYLKAGWYRTKEEALYVTLYAPDGRTRSTLRSEVDAYLKVGWYRTKEEALYVTLYAPDGRTRSTLRSEVDAYLRVGWYRTKEEALYVTLYAPDGRTRSTLRSEVDAYLRVGWYRTKEEIYTTMYALDGRTKEVLKADVAANQKVGWYLYPDYVIAKADALLSTNGYSDAVDYVEEIMSKSVGQSYYSTLVNKRNSLCSAWRQKIGCPVAILGSQIRYNSIGIPEVFVFYRNLTPAMLNAFELEFTCIDSYGNVTTDFPTLYNGNFIGYSDTENLEPYGVSGGYWTLYNNERTSSIRNLRMTRAAFSDGTIWKR